MAIPDYLTKPGGYDSLKAEALSLYNKSMSNQIQQQQNNWRNIKPFSGIGSNQYNGMEYGLLGNGSLGWGQSESMKPGEVLGGVVDGVAYGNTPGFESGNGLLGNMTLGGVMDIGTGLMNAYNVFKQVGIQDDYLDMAKEQLGMAKEQWAMTKDEVSRIAKVRNNINSGYQHGNYGPSPESKTYA